MDTLEQLAVPLLEWFRDNARPLPWRDDPTPYHVWLSEIMLQQTRVAAVLDYYNRFLRQAPDIPALAALPCRQIRQRPEGIPHLLPLAQQLVQDFSVRPRGRVKQHDSAVMDSRQKLGVGLIVGGLAVGVPVNVCQTPKDGFIA